MVFGHDYVQRSEQALCEDELLIPVTYVRAWVSEAGRDYKYLENPVQHPDRLRRPL